MRPRIARIAALPDELEALVGALSDAALEAKFVDLAEGILPRAQTDRLMRLCWGIADAPDAGAVALAAGQA